MERKYYDESYCLCSFGEDERKILGYWKEKKKADNEKELINYSSLIILYDSYIKLVGKLI